MTDELKTLDAEAAEAAQDVGAELVVQLARTLRVAAVHDLGNEAAKQAAEDLRRRIERSLDVLRTIRLQVGTGGLYVNNAFLKLKGAAFESGGQLVELFERLGIVELELAEPLGPSDTRTFLSHYQAHVRSPDPTQFAVVKLPKIAWRSRARARSVRIDRRTELARAYAQLVVFSSEAFDALRTERVFEVVRLRRVVQQLIDAARGQGDLLVGLVHYPPSEVTSATHAVATAALVLSMAQRLGVGRRAQVELVLCALVHDLGAEPGERIEPGPRTIRTVLGIARIVRAADALERVAVALEVRGAQGEDARLQPGVPARLVAVASAYVRLVQPPGEQVALRPEQAVRLVLDEAGRGFDRRAAKLFAAVVGLYPPGSMVRLTDGRAAVVLSTPEGVDPTRPTVRVLEGDFVLELHREEAGAEILEGMDAGEENPAYYLLA